MTVSLDQWVEIAKDCKYLPENDLKVGPPIHGVLAKCLLDKNEIVNLPQFNRP